MLLTVCSSATGDLLVALADVKDALAITDAQHDETLTRFIRRASSRIETHVGRPLFDQVYQAALPSYGGQILQLPHHPVRSVLRVFDGTDTGAGSRELSSTEYVVDRDRGQLWRSEGWAWTYAAQAEAAPFPIPNAEYPRWLVDFSAGYIPALGKHASATQDGTTTTGTTVPMDLQEAAISLTRSTWYARTRESGIRSKSVGDLSVTYAAQTGSMPDDVLAIIEPYRSVF